MRQKDTEESPVHHKDMACAQCGRKNGEVSAMVTLAWGHALCNYCVSDINELMADSAAAPAAQEVSGAADSVFRKPSEIAAYLDDYVVGQQDAKQSLAIAVYSHYKRLAHPGNNVELTKSNVLMLGPTGTGKTLLAQSVARMLDVPFAIADATSLTQAGYVGDGVETILQRLVQAADGDVARAERGIVFLDEVDKLAKAGAGASLTRDVSGEGVQQALLKILEGAKVSVPVTGNRKVPGAQQAMVDTTNILFICAGAFVPLLEKLKPKKGAKAIGFVADASAGQPAHQEVTPDLLTECGMIPEFIGRLPVVVTLDALDESALEKILVEPKNSVVSQMRELFVMDGAELTFEEGALREVARRSLALNTGARGARSILEKVLKSALFQVPDMPGARVQVNRDLQVTITPARLAA